MLEMGLLWYEPSRGVPLAERVDAAAHRYLERFGEAPNICLVAPSDVEPFDRIAVRSDLRIRPGYLLVGVEREEALPAWRPARRSSDDVEVALLAPDGRIVRRLRPVARTVATRKATPVPLTDLSETPGRRAKQTAPLRSSGRMVPPATKGATVSTGRPKRRTSGP